MQERFKRRIGGYLLEFLADTENCIVYPGADFWMAALVDRCVILPSAHEEFLGVYFADVKDRVD